MTVKAKKPPMRKAQGRRHKAQGQRGEGSESRSVSPSSRTGVVIIGAGRLGAALGRALDACGYEVRALVSRRAAGARRAAVRAGLKTLTLGVNQLERLPSFEILFITTPDDALAETAKRLAALSQPNERIASPQPSGRVALPLTNERVASPRSRGRVALHASGALSSEVLAPLRERGFSVGSMHPLAAVSDTAGGAKSLRRAFYCVEGDAGAVRAARRVVRDLGGQSFTVESRGKALYHAAAVMAAGHVVALFDVAVKTLGGCGLTERRAQEVLLPLLRSTVENLSARTPARALTGSFARADVETVRKHLRALRSLDDSDALAVYMVLGEHSLGLAERAGADAALVERIRRLMREA